MGLWLTGLVDGGRRGVAVAGRGPVKTETRDVAVMVPAFARTAVADALWRAARQLERQAESSASAAVGDRLDRVAEAMAKVAKEISPG